MFFTYTSFVRLYQSIQSWSWVYVNLPMCKINLKTHKMLRLRKHILSSIRFQAWVISNQPYHVGMRSFKRRIDEAGTWTSQIHIAKLQHNFVLTEQSATGSARVAVEGQLWLPNLQHYHGDSQGGVLLLHFETHCPALVFLPLTYINSTGMYANAPFLSHLKHLFFWVGNSKVVGDEFRCCCNVIPVWLGTQIFKEFSITSSCGSTKMVNNILTLEPRQKLT